MKIFAILCYICLVLRHSNAFQDSCTICRCEAKLSSVCELEFRVAWLERNMEAVDGKIAEWVKQQYKIRDLEEKSNMQNYEIIKLKKRLENIESEETPKSPKLELLTMQVNDIERDAIISDAPSEINWISQNLTSLVQKMDEMEIKITKNLTLEVIKLKAEMQQDKKFRRSAETNLNETIDLVQRLNNSNNEWKEMLDRLRRMENSVTDQEKHHIGLTDLEQKLSSLKSAIETVLSFDDTWNKSLNAFNEILSQNQKSIEDLKQESLNFKDVLTFHKEEIQNVNKAITDMNEIASESLSPSKGRSNPDLQTLFNHAEQQLAENFSRYSEIVNERLENALTNEQTKLKKLDSDLKHFQDSVQVTETKLRKDLTSTMEYLKDMEERQKETMTRMEDYLILTLNSWQKETVAPHSLDAMSSNEDDEELVTDTNSDVKQASHEGKETDMFSCSLPNSLDFELLVIQDIVGDLVPLNIEQIHKVPSGSKLRFGCKSFGNSILIDPENEEQISRNFSLECFNTRWKGGNFPQCKLLMGESEIRDYSVYQHDRNKGEDTDVQLMSSLFPTVTIEPNRLNRPYSMMATGPIGELVTYPHTSFTLNCLFPLQISTASSYPTWITNSSGYGHFRRLWPMKVATHKSSLRFVSVTTEDSGIYSCIGPNGKRNDVQLIVRAVECPTLYTEPGNELQIVHRSLPDIRSNIMTSQVFFNCPTGYKNLGASRATCTVYGMWSHLTPFCEKSTEYIHGAHHGNTNGCLPWDMYQNQDIIMEPLQGSKPFYHVGDIMRFTCRDPLAMMHGPSSAICMNNGQWSVTSLPSCVAWT